MSDVDLNQRYVYPLKDTGLSLFVVSLVGGLAWYPWSSLDDGLMLGGLPASAPSAASAPARNAELNPTMMVESMKYLLIWMMLYVAALCLVKTSICFTTLRIATTMPRLRAAVYVLLGLTIATFVTTFVGILLLCRPVEANWDQSIVLEDRGECSPVHSMLGLSYTSTASTIATDLACAVLPAIILWNTQMKLSTKIMVFTVLSFGSFASISTMIRTPYIDHYHRPFDDLAFHIANIPLWSNVETAVGLVAGSLPALRQFFAHRRVPKSTTGGTDGGGSSGLNPPSVGLVTIGGMGATSKSKSRRGPKSNFDVDEAEQGDWTRLEEDTASDKDSTVPRRGIRRDVTYKVETSTLRGQARGSGRD